jgi:hypothetical protein
MAPPYEAGDAMRARSARRIFFPDRRRRNEGRETETADRKRKFIPLLLPESPVETIFSLG